MLIILLITKKSEALYFIRRGNFSLISYLFILKVNVSHCKYFLVLPFFLISNALFCQTVAEINFCFEDLVSNRILYIVGRL